MTTWTRELKLHLDVDAFGTTKAALFDKDESVSVKKSSVLSMIASDHVNLKVYFWRWNPTTQVWDNVDVSGSAMVVMGKKTPTGNPLFSVTSFTESEDDDENVYYAGILDLHTTAITEDTDLVAGKSITAHIDAEVQSGSTRATFQFAATIKPQYYNGTEGDPSVADPTYPSPELLVKRDVLNYALASGAKIIDLSYSGLGLSILPYILITIEKPDADAPLVFGNVYDVTTTSAKVELSATLDRAGYKLKGLIVS